MRKGKCKHFNGVQHDTCRADVRYDALTHINTGGYGIPCLRADGNSSCQKWEEPSDEDVKKSEDAVKAAMDRFAKSLPWISAMKKKHPKGVGTTEETCPICAKRIRFHISSYNGHMHAQCETADCINFME